MARVAAYKKKQHAQGSKKLLKKIINGARRGKGGEKAKGEKLASPEPLLSEMHTGADTRLSQRLNQTNPMMDAGGGAKQDERASGRAEQLVSRGARRIDVKDFLMERKTRKMKAKPTTITTKEPEITGYNSTQSSPSNPPLDLLSLAAEPHSSSKLAGDVMFPIPLVAPVPLVSPNLADGISQLANSLKVQPQSLLQFKLLWWRICSYARSERLARMRNRWSTWRQLFYAQIKAALAELVAQKQQHREALAAHQDEAAQARAAHERAVGDWRQERDSNRRLNERVTKLIADHSQALHETTTEHQTKLSEAKAAHAAEIEAARAELQATAGSTSAMAAEQQAQIDALKAGHAAQMEAMQTQLQDAAGLEQAVAAEQQLNTMLKAEHATALAAMRAEHSKQIQDMGVKHAAEQAAATTKLTRLSAEAEARYTAGMEDLEARHSKVLVSKSLKQLVLVQDHTDRRVVQRGFVRWHALASVPRPQPPLPLRSNANSEQKMTEKHMQEISELEERHAAEHATALEAMVATKAELTAAEAQYKHGIDALSANHSKQIEDMGVKHAAEQAETAAELTRLSAEAEARYKERLADMEAKHNAELVFNSLRQLVLVQDQTDRRAVQRSFLRWHAMASSFAVKEEHSKQIEDMGVKHAAEQAAATTKLTRLSAEAEARYKDGMEGLETKHSQVLISKSLRQLVLVQDQTDRRVVQRSFIRWHAMASVPRPKPPLPPRSNTGSPEKIKAKHMQEISELEERHAAEKTAMVESFVEEDRSLAQRLRNGARGNAARKRRPLASPARRLSMPLVSPAATSRRSSTPY